MDNRLLVLGFLDRLCAGDIDSLGPLLADDFHLKGPLYEFASRDAYIAALRQDGLDPAGLNVLNVTQDGAHVSVSYEYRKPIVTLTVEQQFTVRANRIVDTQLDF